MAINGNLVHHPVRIECLLPIFHMKISKNWNYFTFDVFVVFPTITPFHLSQVNIKTSFGKDFIDGAFVLFSTQHLLAIFGIILIGTLVILTQRRADSRQRLRVRWVMAILLVANVTMWHMGISQTHGHLLEYLFRVCFCSEFFHLQ